MTATVQIGPFRATIDGWEWTSKDATLATVLNAMLDPAGPSGADPQPDYHAALDAVQRLGGEVVSFELTDYKPGVVY